jgi:putative spermidine/putrescine transport system ATP-binding protein
MSIQIEDVTYTYPKGAAGVFDVSLEIAPGELVAIIGASGSGKTTLLRLVAGFLRPQRGVIRLNGKDVTTLAPRQREVGVVFQNYALFPHLSVVDNVAYPLKVRGVAPGERRRQAAEMLERVGLAGFETRAVTQLSGGQQQRVALARALVFQPRALLLDEPLSALDASLRMGMRDEIRRLQRQHRIATLHITHDQEEALSMADRVAILERGRLVQVDTPRRLYDFPRTRDIAAFVGRANLWPGRLTAPDRVRVEFGELILDPQERSVGQACWVLVRPEQVRTGPAANGVNTFACVVERDRFMGSVRRYDARVGGSLIEGETSHRGQITVVHIPPEHVQLLPQT